jgi:hypothetical protein
VIRWTHKSIAIDRSRGSAWNGFVGVVGLGVQHIAEGTDHLLFLLALLLPAPLLARGRRWGEAAGLRAAAVRLLRIVTAFTVGHSATLVLGALGWVRLPAAPVEVLIAVSILVSAVHAARPLFPGREAYVAGGFGLVHGLAFASAIAGLGLDPWRMALSILGFNLGIELMQLAVVAAVAPALLLLARDPLYAPVRWAGAGLAGISALGWIAERAFGLANPLARGAEAVAAHPAIALGLLTGLALAVRGVRALTSVDGAALASPPHQGPGTPSRP